ncbi:DUF5990 family protein [Streptomyces sp. NBC_01408]|uniref:DUF5990 family protein n=1 Tax=Streptomyces sp. NBC_01408 TaxID=2903855 RepID=UPI00224D9CF0|nr:DUF5990 family protein [Streptomyces sp. NBC_01408]MCX4695732.1 DUF5990 family protein [Streptomyces sp. NBC_01408]
MSSLSLRVTGRDLPGLTCGPHQHVHVGVQRGREPEGLAPGDAAEAVWEFTVTRTTAPDGTLDFRGPHVQGRRGARFFYLTWGELPPGGPFGMFRRIKVFFDDLPAPVLELGSASGSLGLTDSCGMPLCGAVRPPVITWSPAA